MALASPAKTIDISTTLTALEPPGVDTYFVAFSPGRGQFCGTPNGYSTSQLPAKIVRDLRDDRINKVLCASFGSNANSFFFTYEMKNSTIAHRAGKTIPEPLKNFVHYASVTSLELAASLRVQLGANGSFVAWAGPLWACQTVPPLLRSTLCQLSSIYTDDEGGSKGVLSSGTLENVAWHDTGSYYVRATDEHLYNFETDTMRQAWMDLWQGYDQVTSLELVDLAHVAINPHSLTGDTFAFFKKAQDGTQHEFILRFEPEPVISRLRNRQAPPQSSNDGTHGQGQIANVPKDAKGFQLYRWANSKRAGRSHTRDSWELDLKKGERVKILRDMGKDWFLVENRRRLKGWVHGTWLDFKETKAHVDPREAFRRFTTDTERLLRMGSIRSFPTLSNYMNACAKEACNSMKQNKDSLGVCVHDLHELLRGSDRYSLEMLRTERNKWHPDKFARFCHPEHRDSLREKAQALFVLFGVLMDWLENARQGKGAV